MIIFEYSVIWDTKNSSCQFCIILQNWLDKFLGSVHVIEYHRRDIFWGYVNVLIYNTADTVNFYNGMLLIVLSFIFAEISTDVKKNGTFNGILTFNLDIIKMLDAKKISNSIAN